MSWPARVIRWSFYALVIIVPLIFLPNTSELFEFNKIIVAYILTVIIACAWASDCILQKKFIFRRTLLDFPILIFLIFQSLSLFFSINFRTSLYGYYSRFNGGLASLLAYALLYWSFATYMDKKSTLRTLHLALSTALLVSLWGVAEHFGIDASKWVQDVQSRVFSTLGQPNWLAAYLVALIFIPLSHLVTSNKLSALHLALSTAMFLTLLFTKSRSGLLAFGLTSAVFWGITFWKLGFGKLKNYLGFGIWSLVIVTLTFAIQNPVRDMIFRSSSSTPALTLSSSPALESGGTESGAIRKIVWDGAIKIWRDGPKNFLLGSGPETFAMAYYQHRPIEHNNTSEWELLYNKAHNEFLNYLANTGFLGLLSYLVLLSIMLWSFKKTMNDNRMTTNDYYMTVALFSGWLSISATNFWGFSVVINQLLLFLLPAMAISLERENLRVEEYKNITKKQIFSVLIFSCSPALILLYSIARYFLADVSYAAGNHDLRAFTMTQDPQYLVSSYQSFSSAFDLNSQEPAITSDFSTVAAYLSVVSTNATLSAQLATQALSLSDSSITQNPFHPNYLKNRSRMFLILASSDPKYYSLADEALVQAAKISPTDPRLPLNRGKIALYQKDLPLARKYFDEALKLKPDLSPQVQYEIDQYASSSAKISP